MTDILVHCDHVGRTYGRGERAVVALHDVTCTVGATDRIALTGPSGSGKSTLLQLVAGLDHSTSGTVTWPAWGGSPFGHPARAGLVFQEASLIPSLSAAENAAFPLLVQGVAPDEAHERAIDALDLLGVGAVAGHEPDELSGGQAQRVAIARALATRPALLLADEPTGKLDSATGAHVVDLLLHACAEVRAGLVVATHDHAVARRMDTTWSINDGELVTP
ncbi:MAG: transporter related protein [Nocardioides sp.]|nr:transporter related protein [Nocardioides sp.]